MSSPPRRLLGRITGWDRLTFAAKRVARYRAASLLASAVSLLPQPLWRLLRWAGSDKELPGWHAYGRTYQSLFRPLKYRPIRFLEIGIGGYGGSLGGRSLLAWQAYFPFGDIIACDIEDKAALTGGRRRIYRTDQSATADLEAITRAEGPFDVIIDDGSHLNAHQIFTFERMFAALKPNGTYIIEDVQTSYWPGKVGANVWDGATIDDPAFARTCCGYFADLAIYLNHAEFLAGQPSDPAKVALARTITSIRFEHNLIIITKGANTDPSLFAADLAAWKPR